MLLLFEYKTRSISERVAKINQLFNLYGYKTVNYSTGF